MTGKRAQQLGIEYAKKNFPGYQALVCTHMDGHNRSGNIHVHIVINSLLKYDVERQDFMERASDSRAGNKHHLTKNYLVHLKQSVMDICHRENLHQVDLLTPAERKVTEKEYWAKRRESLVSGEVLLSIFYTKLLRPFPGQFPVYGILRIKADDVVVGFNLTVVQVLFPFIIQFLTLDVKGGGMAVNPVQIIFLTQYFIPCII